MSSKLNVIEPSEVVQVRNEPLTPMSLVQMAVEQGADIDKLSKLMDMQERWEANQAKKEFVLAMSKFRADCPSINRDQKVSFSTTNYKHASLAGALEQIKSLMAVCGLSHSWRTEQSSGTIMVTCVVTHSMGHSESTTLSSEPDKSGGKNSIQGIGSAVSYLQRYTLFSILGLASQEKDNDGGYAPSSSFTGDVVAAIQSTKTLKELHELWEKLSPEQQKQHTNDVSVRSGELK